MIPKMHKVNLSDQLISSIVELITSGVWHPGQRLPNETEIAASFNVSRNIMREALKILEIFGLLESKTGIGTFVSETSLESIQNMNFFYNLRNNTSIELVLELRLMIEPQAAYFAALRITDEESCKLREIFEIFYAEDLSKNTHKSDFAIHETIGKASGNVLCYNLISSLLNQLRTTLYSDFDRYSNMKTKRDNLKDHTAIIDAITAHNADLAKTLMHNHLYNRLYLLNPTFEKK